MADPKKRLAENAAGDLFVDSTCENWDVCRQLAPETFIEVGDYAAVPRQPETEAEKRRALHAVLSRPVGAIGTARRKELAEVMDDFPLLVEDDVHYCGFNTLKSAGGNSYFIAHKDGNWLIN